MFAAIMPESDSDFIASITPDVMECLLKANFISKLDDLLCPVSDESVAEQCSGDFRLCETVLESSGFDKADAEDIVRVLKAQGACCDCEVLYNVAESSRLKARYWRNCHDG